MSFSQGSCLWRFRAHNLGRNNKSTKPPCNITGLLSSRLLPPSCCSQAFTFSSLVSSLTCSRIKPDDKNCSISKMVEQPKKGEEVAASLEVVLARIRQEAAMGSQATLVALAAAAGGESSSIKNLLEGANIKANCMLDAEPEKMSCDASSCTSQSCEPPVEIKQVPADVLLAYLERKSLKGLLNDDARLVSAISEDGLSPKSMPSTRSPTASPGSAAGSDKDIAGRQMATGIVGKINGSSKNATMLSKNIESERKIRYVFSADELDGTFSEEGWTALLWLAHLGSLEEKDSLNDCGKVGCCEDEEAPTPKDFLLEVHQFTERLLRDFGANPNVGGKYDGVTPLTFAIEGANENLVDLLLQYGADPLLPDLDGDTPADLAVEKLSSCSSTSAKPVSESRKATAPADSEPEDFSTKGNFLKDSAGSSIGGALEFEDVDDAILCPEIDRASGLPLQRDGLSDSEDQKKSVLDYSFLAKYSWVLNKHS
ncbi:unnamed protein product [Amoebophrya sp. A25]|nr:unnamed protein product [Amoebophrya sp. A25]|eukprot:GSA25T00011759001.1